jgi:hypothetical protein
MVRTGFTPVFQLKDIQMTDEIKEEIKPLRLDLGCGKNKREGFSGVDQFAFEGVDFVFNIGEDKWPFEDNSVDEAHCSHTVEHLTAKQRIHFCNELHRVLKQGSGCQVIVPHWGSCRAYGDLTHQWPPVSEFWFYYLAKDWRSTQAPHDDISINPDGYSCDFDCTWGYSQHPSLNVRNQEFQQFAIQFYKEAIQDIVATLKKK